MNALTEKERRAALLRRRVEFVIKYPALGPADSERSARANDLLSLPAAPALGVSGAEKQDCL